MTKSTLVPLPEANSGTSQHWHYMRVHVYNIVSFPGPFIFQMGLETRLQATVIKLMSFPVLGRDLGMNHHMCRKLQGTVERLASFQEVLNGK